MTAKESTETASVAEESDDGLRATMVKQVEDLDELIRDNPLATVGIAVGIGFLVGLLVARR